VVKQGAGCRILETAWEGVWVLNAQAKISYVNQRMLEVLGYTVLEMLGYPLFNFIDNADRAEVEQYFKQPKQGVKKQHRFKFHRKDGSDISLIVSIRSVLGELNEFIGVVGLITDFSECKRNEEMTLCANIAEADKQRLEKEITERQQVEEALAKSEAKWRSLIQNSLDIITLLDADGTVQYESPSVEKVVGYKPEELIGKNIFEFIHPEDVENVVNAFRAVIQTPGTTLTVEFRFQHKGGSWCFLESTGNNLLDDPSVRSVIINSRDITERKWAEEKLHHSASHDELTDLPNRALFLDRLEQALKHAKRREDYVFAVLFLDLDRFKVVNDSLGHTVGDQLLIAISRRLELCLREVDTIARLGGDEFVILLLDIKDVNDVTQTAERIKKELAFPFKLNEQEVFSSVSIGIALSTTGYDQPENLLRDADIALYRAKALGRACHVVFDCDMHTRAVALLRLETNLQQAIKRQEFRLYYQPILSLKTNRIVSFEALARWQHPQRGLISPDEFIPTAEETGLIVPFGYWVLREACQQLRVWQKQFSVNSPLAISVNFSVKQFLQPDLVEKISQILWGADLDAHCLRIEITESVLMENAAAATAVLSQLAALGIQLYMDDFGTGYSSLSYLHRFPVKALKIDRSFISSMSCGNKNSKIVRTIITLASELEIDVIAEGIETVEQLTQLVELQCEYGQGYLFAKPMDAETAEAFMMSNM